MDDHATSSKSDQPPRRYGSSSVVLVGVWLISFCSLYGLLSPYRELVMSQDRQSLLKSRWRGTASVVITGDSRSQHAYNPPILSRALGGRRVVSFGFSSLQYSPPYYAAVDRVLDETNGDAMVILGISPSSFTGRSVQYSRPEFDWFETLALTYADWAIRRLQPMPSWDVVAVLRPDIGVPRREFHYHPDGWIVGDRQPRANGQIEEYRGYYSRERIDTTLVDQLIRQVERWVARGVQVVAIPTATSAAMRDLEQALSGFDEVRFATRLEGAGGAWLPVAERDWETVDGGHLTLEAALDFSQLVATALSQLGSETRGPPPRR